MGFFRRRREKRAEGASQRTRAKAAEAYQQSLTAWQRDHDMLQHCLTFIRNGPGPAEGMLLKSGEGCYFTYGNSSLIESRRGQGHYIGGYSGFSFRLAKGVRYHVGGTRGHYVAGPDEPTAIDTGTMFFTNQRFVFLGDKQSREWAFPKLLGYQHDEAAPRTFVQVSNRQKVSGFDYAPEHSLLLHFVVALCLAAYQGHLADLEASIDDQVKQHEAMKPAPAAIAREGGMQ